MLPWPDYARIGVDNYRLGWRVPVQRLALDDGLVRQARHGNAMQRTIDLTAHLASDADRDRFAAWVAQLGDDWILLPAGAGGPEHAPRLARIAGGRAGVRWTARSRRGRRAWRAEMQLESPETWISRDLWNPLLPVGASSHVYVRASGPFAQIDFHAAGRKILWPPLPDPSVRLPDAWVDGDPPAFLREVLWEREDDGVDRPTNIKLRLASTAAGAGRPAGPQLQTALLPGLAQVMRCGDTSLVVRGIGGATDTTEPYHWKFDVAAMNAFLDPLIAAINAGGTPAVDYALVWAGAGSVVDLATLRSLPNGRPPVVAS